MYYQLFKNLLFAPVVRWLFQARIEGEENVPETGGAILASNHLAAGDTFVMPALLRRQVTFPAKAELFIGNRGLWSKIIAWFLKAVGQVPLDRSGGRVSLDGLSPVLQVLADGGLVGIYPEGTRSPDGRLYKGRTGVARMALAAGVPVIPVAVADTAPIRTAIGLPWIWKPRIVIGRPTTSAPTPRSQRTATRCAGSPTRSCTTSSSSPARPTSTGTARRSRAGR